MTVTDETADRLALRQLVERYRRGADTHDTALYADVFTDDGYLHTGRGEIIRTTRSSPWRHASRATE